MGAAGASIRATLIVSAPAQEHGGNDPTTQLVSSGGAGGWSKPEEPAPEPSEAARASALSAGSNWASQQGRGLAPWGSGPPPSAPVPTRTSFPVDRHLNPEEFPSLAATASLAARKESEKKAREGGQVRAQGGAPRPPRARAAAAGASRPPCSPPLQELKGWADDERDGGRGDPHWWVCRAAQRGAGRGRAGPRGWLPGQGRGACGGGRRRRRLLGRAAPGGGAAAGAAAAAPVRIRDLDRAAGTLELRLCPAPRRALPRPQAAGPLRRRPLRRRRSQAGAMGGRARPAQVRRRPCSPGGPAAAGWAAGTAARTAAPDAGARPAGTTRTRAARRTSTRTSTTSGRAARPAATTATARPAAPTPGTSRRRRRRGATAATTTTTSRCGRALGAGRAGAAVCAQAAARMGRGAEQCSQCISGAPHPRRAAWPLRTRRACCRRRRRPRACTRPAACRSMAGGSTRRRWRRGARRRPPR